MSDFPRRISDHTYDDFAELLRNLRSLGESGAVENPGQWFPVDRFQRSSDADKVILGRAASVLIRDATHPGVIFLCTNMAAWNYECWHPACLDRLEEGPPIVGDHPLGRGTLLKVVADTLCSGRMDDATLVRARAVVFEHAPLPSRMYFMVNRGSQRELELVLSTYTQTENFDAGVVRLAAARLAQMQMNKAKD